MSKAGGGLLRSSPFRSSQELPFLSSSSVGSEQGPEATGKVC